MTPVDQQRARFNEIMRRHIRVEDALKSDADFVREVLSRFEAARATLLIDPNE